MSRSTDFDVRAALVRHLLGLGIPRRCIRHELTLDTSSSGGRADVAVLQPEPPQPLIHMIEIKSGSDRLDRLPEQMRAGNLAFDRCGVAADLRHRDAIGYGCAGAAEVVYFDPATRDLSNSYMGWSVNLVGLNRRSRNTSIAAMARLLWASEAKSVAGRLLGRAPTRHEAISWLQEHACLAEARPLIIAALRERCSNRWEESFWAKFDAAAATTQAAE